MKYTILFRKVLKEVISLLAIALFIYTCTKMSTATVNRKNSKGKNSANGVPTAGDNAWTGKVAAN